MPKLWSWIQQQAPQEGTLRRLSVDTPSQVTLQCDYGTGHPVDNPDVLTKLDDGRHICRECLPSELIDQHPIGRGGARGGCRSDIG